MYTDARGETYYKLALHLHTTRSDGHLTPAQVAAEYRADGYDAVAFTDHWQYGAGGELDGLRILSGCEYNIGGSDTATGVMHIVGIGMREDPALPRTAGRQQVIDAINRAGGVAILAHPGWSLNTVQDAAALHGLVATEIYNAVSESHESMRPYSDYFVDLCANAGLYYGLLATDDAHYYDGSDNRRGWVMVRASSPDEADLLAALRQGSFYATQGPHLSVKRAGRRLHISCSPCCVIATLSNLAWAPSRVARGSGLTQFTYELRPEEAWVRVEVIDENGKRAWSNVLAG